MHEGLNSQTSGTQVLVAYHQLGSKPKIRKYILNLEEEGEWEPQKTLENTSKCTM